MERLEVCLGVRSKGALITNMMRCPIKVIFDVLWYVAVIMSWVL